MVRTGSGWVVASAAGLLRGDDLSDLFEFDDVGPVGDDPVAPCVLGGRRGGEVFVDLGRVEGGVDDPVDELPLVGGCGFEQLLQFVLAVDELAGCSARERPHRGGVFGEPDPVFEEAEHQAVPAVGVGRVGGSGSDAWLGVGGVVEESVVGDAGGGVVPHRGRGWCGGSLSEPGGEPFGWFGLQASVALSAAVWTARR